MVDCLTMLLRLAAEVPVEGFVMVPLVPLAEFAAHEDELFSRMGEHPAIEHAEICEFLPLVAGHFRDERAFAVDDFIVAED